METLPNEELWNEFKRLQAENYSLKNQLVNKNKTIKKKDRLISQLSKKVEEANKNKQHYKNGKRGTFKNGG